jgi:hypothetical protein
MAQLDLFGRSRVAPPVPQKPDPEKIRMILWSALHQLRATEEMPWQPAELRSWQHVFQNMTKWLPAHERNEICRMFESEVSRLQATLPK